MKKCAFIIPYFGRFNDYFQLFLNSCAWNDDFDWLIFTDDTRTFIYPKNVHVAYCSFEEIVTLMEEKIDVPINISSPYKLCDFKPAYGDIFSDYLTDYEFWGHCDIDIIWGKIGDFITDDIFNNYDRIMDRGHLILYRNIDRLNNLYKSIDEDLYVDYRYVFQTKYCCHFDEWEQWHVFFKKNNILTWKAKIIADIVCSKYALSIVDDPQKNTEQVFRWNNGELTRYRRFKNELCTDNWCYIHLQKRKMHVRANNLDDYLIVPNEFIDFLGTKSIEEGLKRRKRFYFDWYKRRARDIIFNILNGALLYRWKKLKYKINNIRSRK